MLGSAGPRREWSANCNHVGFCSGLVFKNFNHCKGQNGILTYEGPYCDPFSKTLGFLCSHFPHRYNQVLLVPENVPKPPQTSTEENCRWYPPTSD